MSNYLDDLYEHLDKVNIFQNMSECEECNAKCNASRRERWLLKEEAERLSCSLPDIVELHGASFFQEGRCTNLREDGKCRIYEFRPLKCRLTPVAFIEKEGRLYWMLNRSCRLMKTADEVRIDYFKDRVTSYVHAIEPLFSQETWDELLTINKAISIFDPYIEGKDCITLREVKM